MKLIIKPGLCLINLILIIHLSYSFRQLPALNNQNTSQFLSVNKPDVLSAAVSPIKKSVSVFGRIGENHLTLEGYTSPGALVELTTGLFTVTEKTFADSTGYFIFRDILLHPFLSKEPCLMATDTKQAVTPPLCLAELPGDRDIYITNVIMPPTLLLAKDQAASGETIIAKGMTTPNSIVNLYLFREEKRWFFTDWIRSAQAKGTPRFDFNSNQKGGFEFNLPSYLPTSHRFFVTSQFLNNPTPKSNVLNLKILDFYQYIIQIIYNLIYLLWSLLNQLMKKPWFLILLEIGLIFLLLFLLGRKKKKLALMVLPPRKLLKTE